MNYLCVRIETTHQACELLAEELAEVTGGCQVDDPATLEELRNAPAPRWDYLDEQALGDPHRTPTVSFYIEQDEDGERTLRMVGILLSEEKDNSFYGSLAMTIKPVQSEDWENNWKQYYKPFTVGKHLIVCPSWEHAENNDNRVLLTMDPLSSFGTGSHATTRLCMEELDTLELGGKRILDVGCGSGILACTALLLGAKYAFACDIEENAMKATQENMEKNHISNEQWHACKGDILSDESFRSLVSKEGPFGVILANIVADVLIAMASYLPAYLEAGGKLIMSGIISEREEEVRNAYAKTQLILTSTEQRDGWSMLVYEKCI